MVKVARRKDHYNNFHENIYRNDIGKPRHGGGKVTEIGMSGWD